MVKETVKNFNQRPKKRNGKPPKMTEDQKQFQKMMEDM